MISVAMATYNGQKYLYEQLQSILNQTKHVDEVVITDDCSTDNTVEIARQFIDDNKLNNWHVYTNNRNLGFSSNFFGAVKKTTGDIIFLADQDDIWEKNKVEVMSSTMENDKKITLLSSKNSFIDNNNLKIKSSAETEIFDKTLHKMPFNFFIGSSVIPGCSTCFRKDARDFLKTHDELNLNKSFGHDWYFNTVSAVFGDCYLINKNLFKRRIHETNVSMGQLNKSTILSSSNKFRMEGFQQIITAHRFIFDNETIKRRLAHSDREKVREMIDFFKRRLTFLTSKNLFIWVSLTFSFRKYYQCAKSYKGAVQLYIADLFYAYNINWKIRNKRN